MSGWVRCTPLSSRQTATLTSPAARVGSAARRYRARCSAPPRPMKKEGTLRAAALRNHIAVRDKAIERGDLDSASTTSARKPHRMRAKGNVQMGNALERFAPPRATHLPPHALGRLGNNRSSSVNMNAVLKRSVDAWTSGSFLGRPERVSVLR